MYITLFKKLLKKTFKYNSDEVLNLVYRLLKNFWKSYIFRRHNLFP